MKISDRVKLFQNSNCLLLVLRNSAVKSDQVTYAMHVILDRIIKSSEEEIIVIFYSSLYRVLPQSSY